MSESRIYTPEEVKPLYSEIVPAYQAAFAGEPWYEVSKCVDPAQRCAGGLSSVAIGQTCETCLSRPVRPAYEEDELESRFEQLAASRPTAWYMERNGEGVSLAAVAWRELPGTIAQEKYSDVSAMEPWLEDILGDAVVWLDEVFADKTKQSFGNLRNFGAMCRGLCNELQSERMAFRTINPRMIAAAKRDFGNAAVVFERQLTVPDRRDFVIINLNEESK